MGPGKSIDKEGWFPMGSVQDSNESSLGGTAANQAAQVAPGPSKRSLEN